MIDEYEQADAEEVDAEAEKWERASTVSFMSPNRIASMMPPRCFFHIERISNAVDRFSLSNVSLSSPDGMYTEPTIN